MLTDEQLAAEYKERADMLRRRAVGVLDDEARADLIRKADELAAIAWELAPRKKIFASKTLFRGLVSS
jgi:hypothetical protein